MAQTSVEKIMKVFKHFDADGNGKISRDELARVLQKLSLHLTPDDIDSLLDQVDKNKDEHVDYREFVCWVTDRSAKETVTLDGFLLGFNFSASLKPLFDAFDRDGCGVIQKHEFLESYQMMINCLQMHPTSKPDTWAHDPNQEHLLVDTNGDQAVSYEEFLQWQLKLLRKSSLPNSELPELFSKLSEALEFIFGIDELCQRNEGHDGSGCFAELQGAIKKVTQISRNIYADLQEEPSFNRVEYVQSCLEDVSFDWHLPPSVAEIKVLIRICSKCHGICLPKFSRHKDCMQRILRDIRKMSIVRQATLSLGYISMCIPSSKGWLVDVVKSNGDDKTHYYYMFSGEWSQVDSSIFQAALESLPQEVQLYGLLKGHAYMSNRLPWEALQAALTTAEHMAVIPAELRWHLKKELQDSLGTSSSEELQLLRKALEEAGSELSAALVFSPLDVMQLLRRHGQFQTSTARLNVMKAIEAYGDAPSKSGLAGGA